MNRLLFKPFQVYWEVQTGLEVNMFILNE